MHFMNLLNLEIERFIRSSPYDVVVQNFFLYPFEADVLRITKSGAVFEYEIKTSKSDYNADFKKKGYGGKLKHDLIRAGLTTPNYFYFILPKGMIPVSEIPSYCGLIEYSWTPANDYRRGYIHLNLVKSAKRLHKKKFDNWQHIAGRMAIRDSSVRNSNYHHAKGLKNKVKNIPAIFGS